MRFSSTAGDFTSITMEESLSPSRQSSASNPLGSPPIEAMDTCGVCFKAADNLFETGTAGVYSCFKCQPLSIVPEVSIGEVDNDQECITILIEDEGPGADGKYHCEVCDKSFQKSQQYQNHVRNHRAERRYVCTYCLKAFSQSNNLRAHLRIHTNERPYKCSECGKAFTQVTNLNNHMRLHTGERPFACPEPGCPKAFAQVTNLNQHRKRHLNGRPVEATYDCTVCGEQFEQRNHMYMHRKQEHTDAKPARSSGAPGEGEHACGLCGATFASGRQLARHATQHRAASGDVPPPITIPPSLEPAYKCMFENCGRAFAEASRHAAHLLQAHQLRVSGNFAARGVTVRARPAARALAPVRRGRPPKVKGEAVVRVDPELIGKSIPYSSQFHFVDTKETGLDMEVTEERTNISNAHSEKVNVISDNEYR